MQNQLDLGTQSDRALTDPRARLDTQPVRETVARRFDIGTEATHSLAERLTESIWNSLPFGRRSAEPAVDLHALLDMYAASVSLLVTYHEEAASFLQTVCETNVYVRSADEVLNEKQKAIVEGERGRLSDAFRMPPLQGDQILSAKVANESVEELLPRMRNALRSQSAALVGAFLTTCARLADQQLLGVVDWSSASSCALTFFRSVVLFTEKRTTHAVGNAITENPGDEDEVYSRTDTVTETGEVEVRKARYEHHLFKANRVAIDKSSTAIPLHFQKLVEAIPAWLRPYVDLVTGVQFREEICETTERVETWTNVRENHVLVSEPAIVLGPIVFTGWGTEEIEAENQRLEEEALADIQRIVCEYGAEGRHRVIIMLVIHQLISQVIFVAGVAGQLPHPLVLGSGWSLMGLFLAISLICYDERARNGIRAPTLFAPTWFAPLSVATFLVGSLSLHLLVIGLTCRIWLAAFVGCVLMFVAVALIRAVAANRNV